MQPTDPASELARLPVPATQSWHVTYVSRVGVHKVNATVCACGMCEHRFDLFGVGHIALDHRGSATSGLNLGFDGLEGAHGAGSQDNLQTGLAEVNSGRGTNAARGARDDGHFALDIHGRAGGWYALLSCAFCGALDKCDDLRYNKRARDVLIGPWQLTLGLRTGSRKPAIVTLVASTSLEEKCAL